ncbi:hypothetical protein [Hyphobacterium sp.]|uniref:hypothetical protein n=1 Tax=Hyphobacterium sp. TaxID=2004662 RepID=UPI003BADA148
MTMLALIIGTLMAQGVPVEASCSLELVQSGASRHGDIALRAHCPEGLPGLQSAADRALGSLDLRVRSGNATAAAEQVHFLETAQGWQAGRGQIILSAGLDYPLDWLAVAEDTVTCTWGARPSREGVPRRTNVRCYTQATVRRDDLVRPAVDAIETAIEATRFLPTEDPYCHEAHLRILPSGNGIELGLITSVIPEGSEAQRFASMCD